MGHHGYSEVRQKFVSATAHNWVDQALQFDTNGYRD